MAIILFPGYFIFRGIFKEELAVPERVAWHWQVRQRLLPCVLHQRVEDRATYRSYAQLLRRMAVGQSYSSGN